MDIIVALALGAGLLGPLVYGLATLDGMRPKRLYPLLRLKEEDGQTSILKVERL